MRVFDAEGTRVTFEHRSDLSPEFDVVKPEAFKYGFELPRNVDFYVSLGRHASAIDALYLEQLIAEVDLLLFEGGSDPFVEDLVASALNDSETDFESSCTFLQNVGDDSSLFNIGLLKLIRKYKKSAAPSDTPLTHRIFADSMRLDTVWRTESRETYDALMNKNIDDRDVWFLHKIKAIVDKKLPYDSANPDRRRKVAISRGASHFQLLRALEFQCEYNPKKSNGSAVVMSDFRALSGGVPILSTKFKA